MYQPEIWHTVRRSRLRNSGARIIVPRAVLRLVTDSRPYTLELDDGTQVRAHTVVIATGARYRTLPLANIDRFEGCGSTTPPPPSNPGYAKARTRSSLAGRFRGAGRGFPLTSRQSRAHPGARRSIDVQYVHYLIRRIEAAPERITVHPHTEVTALSGERHLDTVTWRDLVTGQSDTRHIPNVFLMLGAAPNTEWLDCVALDEKGFVRTGISAASDDPGNSDALSQPLATSSPHFRCR